MEKITVDEKDIKRIQKYVKRSGNLYLEIGKYNDEDFQLLAQTGEMTERLARQIIPELVEDAQRTRDGLEPNNEFKEQIQNVFTTFDTIPKLESYDQYANMDINAIYSNMQICLDLRELDDKFYMCRDLRNIANTVINSINGIDNYDINPEEKEDLEKIQEELRMLLSGNTIDMQGIQDRVNKYNEYAIQIWNNYITDVNGKKNRKFRYVVHNLTSGEIQGEFRTKYMSTSLITNNTMGLYGGSKCGFIIKPTHIISASDKDTFTNNYREDGEEVFNIKPSLKLPQEIEESCVEQTIEVNGEMLNYDMESIYSEIVVDEYEIIGVYCIDNGEKELSTNYERAKKIAEERGLPLREIDISRYRMDKGLEAIPEAKRKQFCENLFKRLCDKNEIFKEFYINDGRMFPNKYYQQFYEKYMTGKDTGDFSVNDIIGIIVELSEKDDKFKPIISDLRKYYIDESAIKQETEKSIDVAKQISEKGVKMKTREEIEEYLGIKIKSVKEDSSKNAYEITEERGAEYGEDIEPTTVRYNAFLGEFEKNKKVLDKESENALLKLLKESIDKGDMETAATCHSILQEDSTFYKNHPNAIGLNFQQGTALFEYEQEKRARIEQVEELKIEQLTEDGIEQRVDDKVQQEDTLKQEYIENNDEKTEKQENVRFEQYEKAIEEEQAKIKEEQEAQMQEYRKARLDEKKKEEERHSEIEKDWNQYQDYENVIAQNTEIGELTESIKYEIFLAEVNGQFSSKMKELIEKVNDLPENERKIVMKEYKHFAEIGNDFEINEQGEIIRNSKTQEVAETERVKPKEENIKDVVENDEKKELDNCQQLNEMMHQEGLRKNDFLSLEYQEVGINDSDLKKAHDILSRTKNKSEIEQVYNQEQK